MTKQKPKFVLKPEKSVCAYATRAPRLQSYINVKRGAVRLEVFDAARRRPRAERRRVQLQGALESWRKSDATYTTPTSNSTKPSRPKCKTKRCKIHKNEPFRFY